MLARLRGYSVPLIKRMAQIAEQPASQVYILVHELLLDDGQAAAVSVYLHSIRCSQHGDSLVSYSITEPDWPPYLLCPMFNISQPERLPAKVKTRK